MRVCWGTTRIVLLIGRWAIKVPAVVEWRLFLQGLLANMQERRFSRTGWPELCPVVFSLPGGWLILMRRAEPLTDEQWEKVHFDLNNGKLHCELDHLWIQGVDYVVPVENKINSFGTLDGKIVAVDYGN